MSFSKLMRYLRRKEWLLSCVVILHYLILNGAKKIKLLQVSDKREYQDFYVSFIIQCMQIKEVFWKFFALKSSSGIPFLFVAQHQRTRPSLKIFFCKAKNGSWPFIKKYGYHFFMLTPFRVNLLLFIIKRSTI